MCQLSIGWDEMIPLDLQGIWIQWVQALPKLQAISLNVTRQGSSMGKCCSNALHKLRPILVCGLLRIGGRVQNSPLNVDARHPFVLPKRHHVTELIIRRYHLRVGHCGTQYVLAATRERFWIVHGHSTVPHYLKNCQTCLLWKARACGQILAPLPKCRVTPRFRAFSCTGVDYLGGPILVKVGRKHAKRYGCLFTCMACRAVHLEVAYSLTANQWHTQKIFMGGFPFSSIRWSFVFGVCCLWRHNLTSYSCFQTNVWRSLLT